MCIKSSCCFLLSVNVATGFDVGIVMLLRMIDSYRSEFGLCCYNDSRKACFLSVHYAGFRTGIGLNED